MNRPRSTTLLPATVVCSLLAVATCLTASCRGESAADGDGDSATPRPPASTRVTVGTIHHRRSPDASEGAFRTTLADGTELAIEAAHFVVSAVEFHACVSDDTPSPDGPTINDLRDLLVSPARAHVTSSSNRLGTPAVESLTYDFDSAQILGEIAPPAGTYCRIAVVVAPADRDVVNSTDVDTDAIVGRTAVIEGRRRSTPDASWEPFRWTTDRSAVFTFPARDPQSGESPLRLAPERGETMLLIDKTVTNRTFAVDLDADEPAREVLERVGDTMEVYTY